MVDFRWILFCSLCLQGCIYKSVNYDRELSLSIRSVCIGKIYDTSGLPVAHGLLQRELEFTFARDGHLRLRQTKDADIYVRAHLRKNTRYAAGSGNVKERIDPNIPTSGVMPKPSQWPRLSVLNEGLSDKESSSITVDIEIWNLNSKKLLFKKTYTQKNSFKTHIVSKNFKPFHQHLRHIEAQHESFREQSRLISERVVSDFFNALTFK